MLGADVSMLLNLQLGRLLIAIVERGQALQVHWRVERGGETGHRWDGRDMSGRLERGACQSMFWSKPTTCPQCPSALSSEDLL